MRGVVSIFNETSHSFFVMKKNMLLASEDIKQKQNELSLCGVVREHLLPSRVVTAKWVVSCTRITCIQPLSRCSLTLLTSSFFSESVVVFSLFSRSFSPCVLSFFIFGLLAVSYPLVSLPD